MKVAPTRRGSMDSTPGRSGDSHPRRLVEERREEYVLPCPALPQLKFVRWTGEDSSRAEVRDFLSFFGGSSSRYQVSTTYLAVFHSISNSIDKQRLY